MTKEEYKKETKLAVDIINAMNSLVGTEYYPNYAQSIFDTDTLVRGLKLFKNFIEDTIEHIENVDNAYKEGSKYDVFVEKCSRGEFSIAKWGEIPNVARKELMDTYLGLVCGLNNLSPEDYGHLFSKSVQIFKDKYNINKIEI
jgi:hypothetical protein